MHAFKLLKLIFFFIYNNNDDHSRRRWKRENLNLTHSNQPPPTQLNSHTKFSNDNKNETFQKSHLENNQGKLELRSEKVKFS